MKIIKEDDDIGVYNPNKKPHTVEEQKLAEKLFDLIEDLIVDDTLGNHSKSDMQVKINRRGKCYGV